MPDAADPLCLCPRPCAKHTAHAFDIIMLQVRLGYTLCVMDYVYTCCVFWLAAREGVY